ncbi:Gfo/Idh/MocA family oxidoreductase [Propioniciclava coleopterorum]|uniref:Gfo/Idh/MocA family oxidoreductase n=1 Tax=Propioniciclava coleopterorum TaxID=2714937 RepID=A0A6G7Y9Q9_9ACTN|nr:Gfo/Idh/MocA family oxidoreductase [Propioniciclava coleopterorum]QIK73416.1 Gfo/Idh/MocA family oxidoreductase [Propioniciclava coleopterorum]
MADIGVGIVGTGFIAEIHVAALRRVARHNVQVVACASPDSAAFAARHGIPVHHPDFEALLADESVDVIDICTPPALHAGMVRRALEAGKHVICEKPFTGFFDVGERGADGFDRQEMYDVVMAEMDELRDAVRRSGLVFGYAENYIYAPAVQKSRELIQAAGSKVLLIRGEESHSGSHAPHAAQWRANGGGSLIRQGCHPLSAILYLKQAEAQARGTTVAVASVLGEQATLSNLLTERERRHIAARPFDVEDSATLLLTFDDGTRGIVNACDMVVGGVRNEVEVFTNESVHLCQISQNDAMRVFHIEEPRGIHLTEKVETTAGWQDVQLEELVMRGYVGEMEDFVECVANGGTPQSDIELAYATTQVLYAGYLSASTDRRVHLQDRADTRVP